MWPGIWAGKILYKSDTIPRQMLFPAHEVLSGLSPGILQNAKDPSGFMTAGVFCFSAGIIPAA